MPGRRLGLYTAYDLLSHVSGSSAGQDGQVARAGVDPLEVARRRARLGASMILENARSAARALRTNRLRSALTMLGIIMGVASLIMMVAVGSAPRPA